MSSKLPHVPFFYIIRHKPSGKFYAGAKWSVDANPTNFMVEGGYTTSSKTINNLITETGLDSFEVVKIVTEFQSTAYEYETEFLQTNNIDKDDNWLNKHNNTGYYDVPYGSDEFKEIMLREYGVEYPMQSPIIQERAKETLTENYGFPYWLQSQEGIEKFNKSMQNNHGVDWSFESPIIRAKSTTTNMDRYGVTYPFLSEDIKAKRDITWEEKYGGNPWSNQEIREKCNSTWDEKYGGHPMKNAEVLAGRVATTQEKYGVNHTTQLESMKEKSKATMIEKTGFDNISKTPERRAELSIMAANSTSWNDGINEFKLTVSQFPEPHWVKGGLPRRKRTAAESDAASKRQAGSKLYNDGVKNYLVQAGQVPDQNWILGKIKKAKI